MNWLVIAAQGLLASTCVFAYFLLIVRYVPRGTQWLWEEMFVEQIRALEAKRPSVPH